MNYLEKARRKISEVGLLYALQQTKWTFLPDWLVELNVWNVNTIDIRGLANVTRHDPALRWATNRDIADLAAYGVRPEDLAYTFGKTLKIAVYEHEGRIVGYGQYAVDSWNQDVWLRFRFAPKDLIGAGIWVAPEFRGQRIAPQIMSFAWSHFARNGYHRVVNIINALNHNSTRACSKVGTLSAERFLYFRLLGFSYLRYGAVRAFGRWSRRNRFEVMLGEREPLAATEPDVAADAMVIPFHPRQA